MGSGAIILNQPGVYLVDVDGNAITVTDGLAIGSAEALIIAGKDGANARFVRVASDGTVRIDPTGTTTQPISATSLPLPTGAATAALQTQPGVDIGDVTVNNAGGGAAVNIQDGGNSITVDGPLTDAELRASAVPVSAASLPLPTGAATEATLATRASETSLVAQSLVDNAVFTDGTTRIVPAGFILDETAGTALVENDAGAARIDDKRAQVLVVEDFSVRGRRLQITATNAAKVDGSDVTQPVSAVTLPLPAGAATEATLATRATETTLASLLSAFNAEDFATQTTLASVLANQTNKTQFTKITDGTNDTVVVVDDEGINRLRVEAGLRVRKLANQLPDPDSFDLGARGTIRTDHKDRLVACSHITSDEGTYRDDFTSAFESALTGTYTFGATKTVTGSGTLFTTELTKDSVIRLTSDAQSVAVKVAQIYSDTLLELEEAYTGTAGSGAATESNWTFAPGTGMTISQSGTNLTIASGTTAFSTSRVSRLFQGPGDLGALVSVSQRIANQELQIGMVGKGSSQSAALFVFDGTLNNKVKLRARSSGGTVDESTYTFPVGETTATQHRYKIEIAHEFVRFFVDEILAGEKKFHNPDPYERMGAGIHVVNTGVPSSSTDIVVDGFYLTQRTVVEVKVSGALDNITVDTNGNLNVNIAVSSQALPLLVNPNFEKADGAIVAQQYKRVIEYTVPADFDGWLIRFSSLQAESAKSRLVAFIEMGVLEFISDVYTAGASYVAPQWSAVIESEVTTQLSAAGAPTVTVTVTYTNQSGVSGRTGTMVIPKSSIVGTRTRLILQTGDIGVQSIQNITDDSPNAGAIKMIGFIQLAYHNDLSTTNQLETNYQPGAIAFPTGTKLAVEYLGGTVSKDRLFDMLIQLVAVVPE